MEIWKDIKGYEGLYQVSSLGRVKSLSRGKLNYKGKYMTEEKILKAGNERGYSRVSLGKEHKYKNYTVHRLVGQAFLGLDISNKKSYILHKDETLTNGRLNNSLDNLWIGNHSDNMKDMVTKGRNYCPTKMGLGKKRMLNEYQIYRIRLLLELGEHQSKIGKLFGVRQDYISRIKSGKSYLDIIF